MGVFTAKRTERDGVLVAYEGERMTEQEALRRGLVEPEPEPKPEPEPEKKPRARRTAKEG